MVVWGWRCCWFWGKGVCNPMLRGKSLRLMLTIFRGHEMGTKTGICKFKNGASSISIGDPTTRLVLSISRIME